MDPKHAYVMISVQLSAAAAVLWSAAQLGTGGLAPIVLAISTSLVLGIPITQWVWRQHSREDPRARAMRALGRVACTALLAGVWSQAAESSSTLLALAGLLGGLSLGRLRPAAGIPLAVLAIIVAVVEADAPPWTLMQPVWHTSRDWLALAIGTGFLLSGTGWGVFLGSDPRSPKVRGTVWRAAALSGLLVVIAAWAWASGFEAHAGDPRPYAPLAVALLACTACGWTRCGGSVDRWDFALLAGWCLVTGGPFPPDMPMYWTIVLLCPPAAAALWMAWESASTSRVVSVTALLGLFGAGWWGWPGFGTSAVAASIATLPLLAMFWVAAGTMAEERVV